MNAEQGHPGKLVSIEPYPNDVLRRGFPGLSQLIPRKVEEVGSEIFSQLQPNDILFIDSSHVVRMGGDVNFLFLEVLPTLAQGVLIHIHDIFFPYQYPKEWVLGQHRFWTEQYLLQALLTGSKQFEVLWCGSLMYSRCGDRLKEAFPPPEGLGSGKDYFSSSFWMKKVA
jgi:hypothetical protein